MAFALVQHNGIVTGSNVYSNAYGSNVTAGNLLLVVVCNTSSSGTITTPIANTGTAGAQTWNPALPTPYQSGTLNRTLQAWWAIASGTGSCTVTMTWGANTGDFYVVEYSGASPLLQAVPATTAQGTSASILTPSLTTALRDNLVIGWANCANQGTPQSPWVNLNAAFTDPVFWQPNVSAGIYTPNVTLTSGNWANVMFALGLPVTLAPAPRLPISLGPAAMYKGGRPLQAMFPPPVVPLAPSLPTAATGRTGELAAAMAGNLILGGGVLPVTTSSAANVPGYLPRTLGPMAVGPTFFAALYVPPVPPANAGSLARSIGNTSLSTTACSRVLALPRPTADTSATTDAVTAVRSDPRASADTSASSTALTRTLALPRSTADTSLSSTTSSRVLGLPRATTDTSLSSTSTTRVLRLPRSSADTSLSTTTATRTVQFARSAADTSLSSTSVTRVLSLPRSTADTSLSATTTTRVLHLPRSTADTSLSTDAATPAKGYVRASTDTSISTNVTSRVARYPRTAANTSLSTDVASANFISSGPKGPKITPPTTSTLTPYTSNSTLRPYATTATFHYASAATIFDRGAVATIRVYSSSATIIVRSDGAAVRQSSSDARIGPTLG